MRRNKFHDYDEHRFLKIHEIIIDIVNFKISY